MNGLAIRCALKGNPGNVMFNYLAALRLRNVIGHGRIVGVELPMWNIAIADEAKSGKPTLHLPRDLEHRTRGRVPFHGVADRLRRNAISQIELEGYCQHTDNLPVRGSFDEERLFDGSGSDAVGYGDDTLLISLRGSEILNAIHSDYTLLPVEFYVDIVRRTGLTPVFFGQFGDNPYVEALRAALPQAVFQPGRNPLHDFEVIRRSRNICLSVSTFAWLAGWLSHASRIIMPVTGLFHPNQHRQSWFITRGDTRYEHYLFPINRAVPVSTYRRAHDAIGRQWRAISEPALTEMLSGPPRQPIRLDRYIPVFDATHYVSVRPDQRGNREAHGDNAVLDHFIAEGFWAGVVPFDIDRQWYCEAYPDAAVSIGSNEYADEAHHYVEVGRDRGYRPRPS